MQSTNSKMRHKVVALMILVALLLVACGQADVTGIVVEKATGTKFLLEIDTGERYNRVLEVSEETYFVVEVGGRYTFTYITPKIGGSQWKLKKGD